MSRNHVEISIQTGEYQVFEKRYKNFLVIRNPNIFVKGADQIILKEVVGNTETGRSMSGLEVAYKEKIDDETYIISWNWKNDD